MKETIYKEDAINAIVKCTNCNTPEFLREYVAEHSLWSQWSGGVLEALEAVEGLPSAQPEEHTETHACDCISRRDAIIAVRAHRIDINDPKKIVKKSYEDVIKELPSAQLEIIRCKDCKHGIDYYHDGDCYCSNPKWELTYFGGSWEFYCGDAERREE